MSVLMSVLSVGVVILMTIFTAVIDDDFAKDDLRTAVLYMLCAVTAIALFVISCLIQSYQHLIGILP